MSTTADTVFRQAMAIADEVLTTNVFTASDFDEYKVRVPYILTMLENEFLDVGVNPTTYALGETDSPFSTATGSETYLRVSMPSDFIKLTEVTYEDEYGNFTQMLTPTEGYVTVLLPPITTGQYNISYLAAPSVISALTDTLHVNDRIARSILPYGLAAELFKEENPDVFQFASVRYAQLKKEYKKPCTVTQTIDCYR